MKILAKALYTMPQFEGVLQCIKDEKFPIGIKGLVESSRPFFMYSLLSEVQKSCVIITNSRVKAKSMYEQLAVFMGDDVIHIPARELILHDVEAKSHIDEIIRVKSLYKLLNNDYKIAIAPIEALCIKVTEKEKFSKAIIKIETNKTYDINNLMTQLINSGYEFTDMVESVGQFSKRGDILDIFSPSYDSPIRIEFFDDEVDLIRIFDVDTQRSIKSREKITILPCSEQIVSKDDIQNLCDDFCEDENLSERLKEDKEKLLTGLYNLPLDKYFSMMPFAVTAFDYIDDKSLIVLDNDVRSLSKLDNMLSEYGIMIEKLLASEKILQKGTNLITSFFKAAKGRKIAMILADIQGYDVNFSPKIEFNFLTRENTSYRGRMDLLLEDINKWKVHNKKIVLFTPTKKSGKILNEYLNENNVYAKHVDSLKNEEVLSAITIVDKGIFEGFEFLDAKLCIIGSKKIFRKTGKETSKRKKGRDIDLFATLNVFDYVVHDVHGIGKYMGLKKMEVGGITKDYLHILYKNDDSVYIPVSKMEMIQKFIGGDGKAPRLSKLGGSEWETTKKRVKSKVKDIAKELIALYAIRNELNGYEFSQDTVWQSAFEEQFPYEETKDQLRCIEEIKADMETQKVMDRLLCGDVGYGKTEVAIRAAFKAIMEGKQVAFLVPTTILAYQHYNNFIKRMSDFPIKVDLLCRFRSKKEQNKTITKLKAGTVDLVVGTHRLLQKDMGYKDLGLLIIDEEQRFGVEHKEKMKSYKKNVDVLTLSATPIPRTLNMSLSGIRDISIIEDPPGKRFPVQTYVMEYDYDVVKDAIDRELARNGQVFYLYNRVKDMDLKYSKLNKILGEDVKIGIAHGQMDERRLENVMKDFINKEYDVLLCTTIIESGLDIPNVNTIIIEDANRMGLSQLYQIRGRVGRSDKVAYAYITYQKGKVITEEASKRLEAIREFTEFGSGFKIAMKDLEIRGAGNVLGVNQHGHLDKVGYDMYIRLLNNAINELKGNYIQSEIKEEATIEFVVNAYIKNTYIPNDLQRMDIYKRISAIKNEDEKQELIDELIDRFGDVPNECVNLLDVAIIKHYANNNDFKAVSQRSYGIEFMFSESAQPNLNIITLIAKQFKEKILLKSGSTIRLIVYSDKKDKQIIELTKKILEFFNKFEIQ